MCILRTLVVNSFRSISRTSTLALFMKSTIVTLNRIGKRHLQELSLSGSQRQDNRRPFLFLRKFLSIRCKCVQVAKLNAFLSILNVGGLCVSFFFEVYLFWYRIKWVFVSWSISDISNLRKESILALWGGERQEIRCGKQS